MLLRKWTLPLAARLVLCLGACAIALVAVSACSTGSTTARDDGALVRVTARDFHIKVSPARVRAGDVRLVVRNKGPDTHELLIVRAGRRLPLRSDGLTVDEEKLEPVTVATVEGEPPDAVEVLRLKLRPGRYELFCNMAGHYLGGMRARLVVT
jgi:uncharacterized cupredoxin-like copper-binding protein